MPTDPVQCGSFAAVLEVSQRSEVPNRAGPRPCGRIDPALPALPLSTPLELCVVAVSALTAVGGGRTGGGGLSSRAPLSRDWPVSVTGRRGWKSYPHQWARDSRLMWGAVIWLSIGTGSAMCLCLYGGGGVIAGCGAATSFFLIALGANEYELRRTLSGS